MNISPLHASKMMYNGDATNKGKRVTLESAQFTCD